MWLYTSSSAWLKLRGCWSVIHGLSRASLINIFIQLPGEAQFVFDPTDLTSYLVGYRSRREDSDTAFHKRVTLPP